jgi:hypothetical protein
LRRAATDIGLCALWLLAWASPVLAGASLIGPRPVDSEPEVRGLDVGFWVSSSHPTGNAGDGLDRSFKAGGTLTWMRAKTLGLGLALDYCRWRSTSAGAALDEVFSAIGGSEIHGTTITTSGLRGTMRVVQSVPTEGRIVPWLQVGFGLCRLNRKIVFPVAQLQNAGWQVSGSGGRTLSIEPMFLGGLGLDVKANESMKIGLDATGELIYVKDSADPITAVTIGGHVLFGHWWVGR